MDSEAVRGQRHYLEVMALIHAHLRPDLYMEVGVRNAHSLRLAQGSAVGIDPSKQFDVPLPDTTLFYEMTSDDFFAAARNSHIEDKVDFAFINGMHLFEYSLRDFINIESYTKPWSLVVFDDVFPNHPLQAARERETTVWTGDVWKIRNCLKQYRPDLIQIYLDTWPSGLLLVLGLDANNLSLSDNYTKIIEDYVDKPMTVPEQILHRAGSLPPTDELIAAICALIIKVRDSAHPREELHKLRGLMTWRGV